MTELEHALAKTERLYKQIDADTSGLMADLQSGATTCVGPDGSDKTADLIAIQRELLALVRPTLARIEADK